MNIIQDIFGSDLFKRIFWSAIVIIGSIAVYGLISRFLKSREKKNLKIFSTKKNRTYLHILRNVAGVMLSGMAFLTILQIFGVNVSSMLAGVGIASIVISFALQDALKDIIRGIEIISDNYYGIGDFIKYGDNVGEVLSIGLRTTRMRDMNSMNIVSIANRNIDQVELVSEYIYLPVPFSYDVGLDKVEEIVDKIGTQLKELDHVKTVEYQGLSSLSNGISNYQFAITCDPANKLAVNRAALGVIVETFSENHLNLPCQQIGITK